RTRVCQPVVPDLRQLLVRQSPLFSLEFHERYASGRLSSRQTADLEALRELLDDGIASLASGLLFMSFTGSSLVLLDWRAGLVLLVAVIPVWLVTRWFQKRSQVLCRISRAASARLVVTFVETM